MEAKGNVHHLRPLIVGHGEGRATREVELIWWPALYKISEHAAFRQSHIM